MVLGLAKAAWLHRDSGLRDLAASRSLVRFMWDEMLWGNRKKGDGMSWPGEEGVPKTCSVSFQNFPEATRAKKAHLAQYPQCHQRPFSLSSGDTPLQEDPQQEDFNLVHPICTCTLHDSGASSE